MTTQEYVELSLSLTSIELSFHSTRSFGWELDVLHTIFSMFGMILVHSWSSCEGLSDKYSISILSTSWHVKFNLSLNQPKYKSVSLKPPH
jgi:hypothetical protein